MNQIDSFSSGARRYLLEEVEGVEYILRQATAFAQWLEQQS